MPKKEKNSMPPENLDRKWGFLESDGDRYPINRSGEEMTPSPDEFSPTHSKRTPCSDSTNFIDWNAPGDGWGEFL